MAAGAPVGLQGGAGCGCPPREGLRGGPRQPLPLSPMPSWRELSTAQRKHCPGQVLGTAKLFVTPTILLRLFFFLLFLTQVISFGEIWSVKCLWVYEGTGWELESFLTYWRNGLENKRVQFHKETPKGEALTNRFCLPLEQKHRWSHSVAAARLGSPGMQHLLPKVVGMGRDSASPGLGVLGRPQPGPAHTALILRSVMVSGVTVIVVF